jgi:hypothetical protein
MAMGKKGRVPLGKAQKKKAYKAKKERELNNNQE